MIKTVFATAALAALLSGQGLAGDAPAPSDADCVRIEEARRIAVEVGEGIWPGWGEAPFTILLVTPDHEFLVYHPRPGDTFEDTGHDARLDAHVFVRERVFNPAMQATFPLDGVPTIVIGQPRHTASGHTTRWTLTLLHEHFHQWQQSRPDYFSATAALDLAGSDTTGMWMLNYPFPYDDEELNGLFTTLCRRLRDAVSDGSAEALARYLTTREALRQALDPADFKYFSLQVWQEGVPRHTEYVLGNRAAASYRPSEAFAALDDGEDFGAVAAQMKEHILTELGAMSLRNLRRIAFYHVGAAEAMLLDRHRPGWRSRYFEDKFQMGKYFEGVSSAD